MGHCLCHSLCPFCTKHRPAGSPHSSSQSSGGGVGGFHSRVLPAHGSEERWEKFCLLATEPSLCPHAPVPRIHPGLGDVQPTAAGALRTGIGPAAKGGVQETCGPV